MKGRWSKINTLPLDEQLFRRASHSTWSSLFNEVCTSLDRTENGKMLQVWFDDVVQAWKAFNALKRMFNKRHGEGFVDMVVRKDDASDRAFIAIAHGPHYQNRA